MSKTVLYSKSFQQNMIEFYKGFCPLNGGKIYKNSTTGKTNGKFYTNGTKEVSNDELIDYYGDKTKGVKVYNLSIEISEIKDKTTLKYTYTIRTRSVGKQFFRVRKIIRFITYNNRTKNFYHGTIEKKRKKILKKRLRCNAFYLPIITELKLGIRRNIHSIVANTKDWKEMISTDGSGKPIADRITNEVIKTYALTLFKKTNIMFDYKSNYLEGELYKLYLKDNGISYPDSVYQYTVINTPKKQLKKVGNLVQWFMDNSRLGGRKVRTILNKPGEIDFITLVESYHVFGVDYLNQITDEFFYNNTLYQSTYHSYHLNSYIFSDVEVYELSNLDKKRFVNLINIEKGKIEWTLIKDHLIMIRKLKEYGEEFKMKFNNRKDFDDEHYDLSDLLESYRKGTVTRIYNNEFIDEIQECIMGEYVDYYPVLLTTSKQYNEEAQIQSNCVRTYIEKAESIIISLREGGPESKERATLEYHISINGLHRVQSRGRFNRLLGEQWNVPLEILDNRVNILFKNKKIDLPKFKKEFKNGREVIVNAILGEQDKTNIIDLWGDNDLPF